MRESPRLRRLRTDLQVLQAMQADSTILDFKAFGNPPEEYLVRFLGDGLSRDPESGEVVVQKTHEVRIRFGASYPRQMPEMHWETPFFHPNVSGSGAICLGGYGNYWVPSLNLDELCDMLWDMIRYQNFDVTSPYNHEASKWAKYQSAFQFPVDLRPLRDKVAREAPSRRPPPLPAQEVMFISEENTLPSEARGAAAESAPEDIFVIE